MSIDVSRLPCLERVALDASVLLGADRRYLVAGATLRYYSAFWSSWIVGEFVRKRVEWITRRAARERAEPADVTRRLRESRRRVNALVDELSHVLQSVDYAEAPLADLTWLADPDDRPVMQTALAARADVLVTDNRKDFPVGQERNGILLLDGKTFLAAIYRRFSNAEAAIQEYLGEDQPSHT